MGKQYSARNSGIHQPSNNNKNHVSLNSPHRVEAIDTLTIDIAIAPVQFAPSSRKFRRPESLVVVFRLKHPNLLRNRDDLYNIS